MNGKRSGVTYIRLREFPPLANIPRSIIFTNIMATGGGSKKDRDYSKTWKDASSFMERQPTKSSTPPKRANEPMDDRDIDPGELLQKDMINMSINRDPDPKDPDNPEDEVSHPTSVFTSSESIASVPHISGSNTDDNLTVRQAADRRVDIPKTSTPKGSKKNPKNKITKVKSLTSNIAKKSDKTTASPRIDAFLINTNQAKKTSDASAPTVPNILDWYDAVDLPGTNIEKLKNTTPPTVELNPLPQREDSKCTKRIRIASDGTGLATASTNNNVTIRHSDDVIYVNVPSAPTTEEKRTQNNVEKPSAIPWLLDHYSSKKPLPESLIGKKVRFQPESDPPNNGNPTTKPQSQPVTNPNSDSLQAGGNDFLNITDEAIPFFKRARGCLSAASKADARATHIDELVSRGVPTPWALRLEPLPAYLMPVAHELTDIQRTNALKLMSESSASLRKCCCNLVRQGNMNWNIVSKCIGDNDTELDQARLKMDGLVARDFEREKVRLDARNANLIAHSVTNKTIVENLRVRGYNNPNRRQQDRPTQNRENQVEKGQDNDQAPPNNAGARPKDPPPPNQPQRGYGKRRRSNSRSRSRSPSRGRGRYGPSNRGRGRGSRAYSDFRRPSQNNDVVEPEAMAAIVRKVCQEMNQPNNYQNPRGSRDQNYRY